MAADEVAGGARKATKSKLFEFLVHGVVSGGKLRGRVSYLARAEWRAVGRGREGAPALPPATAGTAARGPAPGRSRRPGTRTRRQAAAGDGFPGGQGGVCLGSCQGLGLGRGHCPPTPKWGSPLYQTCFLPFFPLWAQVLPLPWGWGWGTWRGLDCRFIGWESVSDCISGARSR